MLFRSVDPKIVLCLFLRSVVEGGRLAAFEPERDPHALSAKATRDADMFEAFLKDKEAVEVRPRLLICVPTLPETSSFAFYYPVRERAW